MPSEYILPFNRKEFLCSLRNHVQWQPGLATALQPISLLYTGHWSVAFEQGQWRRICPASDRWCMPQIRLCDTSEFESKELQSVIWLDHTHLPWIGSTLAVWLTFSRISERHHQAEGPYVLVQDITSCYFKRHLSKTFRKIKSEVEINRIEDAPEIVVASCVLHDICLIAEDDVDEFLDDATMAMMMMMLFAVMNFPQRQKGMAKEI